MRETNRENRDYEVEIDLKKLFSVFLHRWWLIILCIFLGGVLAFGYTKFFVTPLYKSTVTVYVNNGRPGQQVDSISGGNLQTSQRLVSTYVNIIKSDTVLSHVIEAFNLGCSVEELRNMMSTEQVSDTELFRISILHPDPEASAKIANAVAAVAPEEIAEFVGGSSTKIIDYAKVPTARHSPSYSRNTVLGCFLGALAAILYLVLVYLLDVRIKGEEDLTQLFDYPVIGQIPLFEQAKKGKGRSLVQGSGKRGA